MNGHCSSEWSLAQRLSILSLLCPPLPRPGGSTLPLTVRNPAVYRTQQCINPSYACVRGALCWSALSSEGFLEQWGSSGVAFSLDQALAKNPNPNSNPNLKVSEVAQLCQTLCDPMDCRPPGYSVHGIFQARILEWVAISFSRGPPDPGSKPGLQQCRQLLYRLNPNPNHRPRLVVPCGGPAVSLAGFSGVLVVLGAILGAGWEYGRLFSTRGHFSSPCIAHSFKIQPHLFFFLNRNHQ